MLTIRTDRANRQVDVIFADGDRPDLIDDLHENILPSVPGASQLGSVRDTVVAIRGFDDVVQALADAYRARGEIVEITAVE